MDVTLLAQQRVGKVLRGKWHLDRLIDVGGMAAVYEATHRNGSRAAIKMLHPKFVSDVQARTRFLREGYAANRVGHPCAVAVIDDDFTEEGDVYLVMELLDGESLEARIARDKVMDSLDVLAIADQLLDALACAHSKDIIHRDIKPANVMLTRSGIVKLLDFGLARVRELPAIAGVHSAEIVFGTVAYCSPEAARANNEEMDGRADIWAVAATMFRALAGRTVHGMDGSVVERLIRAAKNQAPPLADFAPGLNPRVCEVIDRGLMFSPDDRWPSAAVMQAVVQDVMSELMEETGAPPSLYYQPALAQMGRVLQASGPQMPVSAHMTPTPRPTPFQATTVTPSPSPYPYPQAQAPRNNPLNQLPPGAAAAAAAAQGQANPLNPLNQVAGRRGGNPLNQVQGGRGVNPLNQVQGGNPLNQVQGGSPVNQVQGAPRPAPVQARGAGSPASYGAASRVATRAPQADVSGGADPRRAVPSTSKRSSASSSSSSSSSVDIDLDEGIEAGESAFDLTITFDEEEEEEAGPKGHAPVRRDTVRDLGAARAAASQDVGRTAAKATVRTRPMSVPILEEDDGIDVDVGSSVEMSREAVMRAEAAARAEAARVEAARVEAARVEAARAEAARVEAARAEAARVEAARAEAARAEAARVEAARVEAARVEAARAEAARAEAARAEAARVEAARVEAARAAEGSGLERRRAPLLSGPPMVGPPVVAPPVVSGPPMVGPVVAPPLLSGPPMVGPPVVAPPVVSGPPMVGPPLVAPQTARGPIPAAPVVAPPTIGRGVAAPPSAGSVAPPVTAPPRGPAAPAPTAPARGPAPRTSAIPEVSSRTATSPDKTVRVAIRPPAGLDEPSRPLERVEEVSASSILSVPDELRAPPSRPPSKAPPGPPPPPAASPGPPPAASPGPPAASAEARRPDPRKTMRIERSSLNLPDLPGLIKPKPPGDKR